MRIAINGRLLIKNKLEGIGFFTWEVLKNMIRLYPEHDYLVLFDRKPDPKFLIPGVEFRILKPSARHPVLYRLWFDVMVPLHLRMWDAEIFLSFDGFTSRNLKIPLVTAIHDLAYVHYPEYMKSTDRRYYQNFQAFFAHRSDKVLTVSQYTADDMVNEFQIDRHKIEVVYNGSRFEDTPPKDDLSILTKYGLKTGKYFLYTGSLHPRKNIQRLVEAFENTEAAQGGTTKLVLAGRKAWDTDGLLKFINESSIWDRVIQTGYIPDHDLWTLLRQAIGLCYVSLFEGFGVPVLDAFHAGTAVICSRTSSLPEVAGDAALLVDEKDTKDITNAMDRLFQDASLRQKLIDKGNEQKRKFSWKATTQRIFHTIEEVYDQRYFQS